MPTSSVNLKTMAHNPDVKKLGYESFDLISRQLVEAWLIPLKITSMFAIVRSMHTR